MAAARHFSAGPLALESTDGSLWIFAGDIAVRKSGKWRTHPGKVWVYLNGAVAIGCTDPRLDALAYPIDPSMTRTDIDGATKIKPNADNTGWVFHHASKGDHEDHYTAVRGAVMSAFQPRIDAALVKRMDAPNQPTRTRAQARYSNLCQFRDAVLESALTAEKAEHQGFFAQDEHHEKGHVDDAVRTAIKALKAKWAREKATEYATIHSDVTRVVLLIKEHTPETRWGKAARLAAANKANEAEAPTNQQGG